MYRIPYTELLRPDYQNGGNHRKLVKMMNEGNYGLRNKDKVVVYDDYWLNFHFVCFTFNNQACDSFTDITAIEEVLATNDLDERIDINVHSLTFCYQMNIIISFAAGSHALDI